MSKILLISDLSDLSRDIIKSIENNGIECILSETNPDNILSQLEQYSPDIILIDVNFKNCEILTKQIKSKTVTQNVQILLLLEKGQDINFLNFADGFITMPVCKNILIHTINSHIKIKKSLEQMSENNRELARSLYQLNVLYNTSSQFAGTLEKKRLYSIMLEALEKTLSFDISCALVFSTQGDNKLYINSLCEPTESLKEALALRVTLEYKNLFENRPLPYKTDLEGIEIIQNIKPSHIQNIFDLRALNYDSLFAPIKVGDHFFGVIELFRKTPFTKEDVTCFQTIVHQVALPLRSATLYEEIKNTNVKLEKLERLKSDFVSIVSHELRTPLTPINNSLEIVLSGQAGEISDDAKNFINMAKRNVTRLSGIIEDLLDLSRVQTGKLDFKYKITNLIPSLELIQKTFEQVSGEKNIDVTLEIKDSLGEVYADNHRIEQIISNLVSNALKFTPENGNIKIIAQTVDENEIDSSLLISPVQKIRGKYVKISVTDTGIGIKEENIPKIFEKFSQIENSLTRNIGGVGLGLPITKQLLDAHLGAIAVKSKEGEGSDFSFYIPLLDKKKMFIMDINHSLSAENECAFIHIKETPACGFIEYILDKGLIKNSKKTREYREENDYWALLPDTSVSALNFMEKTIIEKSREPEWKKCDIVLKKVHCEKDGKDLVKILNKLEI